MKIVRKAADATPSLAPTVWIGSLERVVSVARDQMARGGNRESEATIVADPVLAPSVLIRKSA